MRFVPTDGCPSVVCHTVISRKLSKTDPQLLRNTSRKLASLILLPHSDPLSGALFLFSDATCANICTAVQLWREAAAVIHQADHRLIAGVINCCKQSATLVTCCSHIINRCDDDAKVERAADQLVFAAWYSSINKLCACY